MTSESNSTLPWKTIIFTTIESLLAFYIATFSLAMYFTYRSDNWIPLAIVLGILYLFVIFVCAKRIYDKMTMAMLMLIIPIAPLLAMIMFVSLIPILQWIKS